MYRTTLAVFLATLGVGQVSAQTLETPAIQKVSGNIEWVYDYSTGQALSKESGKPMFVVFRCER